MKLKRNWRLVGLVVAAATLVFTLGGCMSMMVGMMKAMYKDYGVYDTTVPEDQRSQFRFVGVNIKSFNGQPVSWGDKANNMGYISVPAGTHDIVYDWVQEETEMTGSSHNSYTGTTTWNYTTTRRSITDLKISQIEFLPGHNYSLGGVWVNGEVMLYMQDVTNTRSELYGDAIGDAPSASTTATEIEGTWKAADGTWFKFAGNTYEVFVPQGSYMGTSATPPEGANQKGRFEIDGNKITMYLLEAGMSGRYADVTAIKSATIYTYSLAGNNLTLEVEFMLPKEVHVKQ